MKKLKEKAKEINQKIPTIFLCLKDKETPLIAKIFAFLTVAYALSPIDLIPDFIPILGIVDDVILLPLLAFLTMKFIPEVVRKTNLEKSKNLWENGKPKKWFYAIPIVLFYLAIVLILTKVFFFNKA